ncbi:MAG: sugar ABC transporter permease [Oscillospiraceae bacterium]|nr:sugar ABC transporter permease [Oscillospiraceae bacterium]
MVKNNKLAERLPNRTDSGFLAGIRSNRVAKDLWRDKVLYLFLLPAIVLVFVFSYIPMYGVLTAFQDVRIGDSFGTSEWMGLYHFQRFFNGIWVNIILKNTITIAGTSYIFALPSAIGLALLLHNATNARIKKLAQSITYIPHLLSTVVVIAILRLFVDREGGLINILLTKVFHMQNYDFFAEPDAFLPMYIVSGIWANVGSNAVVYIGALASVEEEMVEAARIDGASKLQIIWHIQLPSIRNTIVTMLIINCGSLVSVGADKVLLMQTDLNLEASEVISTYVYKAGVGSSQYGFSSAVGLFQNLINVTMMLVVNFISDKLADTSII